MKQTTRRSFVAASAAGAGALALAACGTGSGTSGSSGSGQQAGGQKLTGRFEFWQPWPIEQPTHGGPIGWKQLMENYNLRGGPQLGIVTPTGNFDQVVQTAFASDSAPDGWQVDQQTNLTYAGKGFSAALDDLIKRDKWDSKQIFSSALETMTWSGKVWAMMQHPDIIFNMISVSLLEENGMSVKDLPTTWRQLDELMIRLTKKSGEGWDVMGGLPHNFADYAVSVPQANGAKIVSDDGRKVQLDSPQLVESMEWVKGHIRRLGGWDSIVQWRINGVLPGENQRQGAETTPNDIFGQRRLAVNVAGNAAMDNIRRWDRKMTTPIKVAFSPIPSGPSGPKDVKVNAYSGGVLEAARKGGPKLELMWDFMKYTASKEGGYWVQLNTSDVAANREAAKDPRILDNPDTGRGRKEFLPFFDTGVGSRTIKHPAVADINAEYSKARLAYLQDKVGNLRDELREANRLAQQKVDEFWAQNPEAGK